MSEALGLEVWLVKLGFGLGIWRENAPVETHGRRSGRRGRRGRRRSEGETKQASGCSSRTPLQNRTFVCVCAGEWGGGACHRPPRQGGGEKTPPDLAALARGSGRREAAAMPAAAGASAAAAASAVGLPLTYVLAGWLGPPRHVAATVLVCKDGTRLVTGSRRGNLWMWRVQRPESPAEPPTVRDVAPAPRVGRQLLGTDAPPRCSAAEGSMRRSRPCWSCWATAPPSRP